MDKREIIETLSGDERGDKVDAIIYLPKLYSQHLEEIAQAKKDKIPEDAPCYVQLIEDFQGLRMQVARINAAAQEAIDKYQL